jgi:hypothetical protein
MDKKRFDRGAATIGWCALLAWWGVSILIDPISIGMSGIGTGIIMFGVNIARLVAGLPTRRATTEVGAIALLWGAVDTALRLGFWASFSVALIVIAAVSATSFLFPRKGAAVEEPKAA